MALNTCQGQISQLGDSNEARNLEEFDPYWMNIEQQCAYVLKCIEAKMDLAQVKESKFRNDDFIFELVISLIVKKGWASTDKSDQWYIKKLPTAHELNMSLTSASA